jgi:hypothetical protein
MAKLLYLSALAIALLPGRAESWAKAEDRPVQSATLEKSLKPDAGFVDTAFTFDSAGTRLLWIQTDGGEKASVVSYDISQKQELATTSLKAVKGQVSRLEPAHDGDHFLVWTPAKRGVLVSLLHKGGKVVRKFGPASDVVRKSYSGKDCLVLHTEKPRKGGKLHTVELKEIATGKRVGKKSSLQLDGSGKSKKLDFELKYWAESYTQAVGIKGGAWDRKEDQRTPDVEGWYEMPAQSFSKRLPIRNVLEHRHKMTALTQHANRPRTVAVKRDLTAIELYEGAKSSSLGLAEPFHHYDPKSLQVQYSASGTLFFSLTIDPVHPDAAAKKRAVKPWLDLYEIAPGAKKARRRARILASGKRRISWSASSSHWAVLPRHIGFDRGGGELLVYKLQ